MRRTALLLAIVTAAPLALTGCPQRKESIEVVGGAAGRQMEVVQQKMDKNVDRLDARANEANKAAE